MISLYYETYNGKNLSDIYFLYSNLDICFVCNKTIFFSNFVVFDNIFQLGSVNNVNLHYNNILYTLYLYTYRHIVLDITGIFNLSKTIEMHNIQNKNKSTDSIDIGIYVTPSRRRCRLLGSAAITNKLRHSPSVAHPLGRQWIAG